jgi:hypothetical protein
MKIFISLIMISLLFGSCHNDKNPVIIKSNSDTIYYGAEYHAELYVPCVDSILPSFFIVNNLDTFRLIVDNVKKCAVFIALGRGKGETLYRGYVEFINKNGKKEKEPYSIKFYVKQQVPVKPRLN